MYLKTGDIISLPEVDYSKNESILTIQTTASHLLISAKSSESSKQLDLIRQIDRSSFIIKALNLFIFILFLVVLLIGVIALRSFIRAKEDLIGKNEQINFYNKKLIEKNAELQQEIKRRIDESIYELSQRDLVLNSFQEYDQKFSAAFYKNPEMILIFELESGIILDCNDLLLQHFGLESVDFIEKSINESNLGFTDSCLDKIRKNFSTQHYIKDLTFTFGDIDAKKRTINANASLIHFRKKDCCIMTLKDITQSYNEQKFIQKIIHRYQFASEYSDIFIWSIDLDMNFEYIDQAIEVHLGYKSAVLIGKSYLSIFSSNSQKLITERIGVMLGKVSSGDFTDATIDEELECISLDGQKKTFRFVGKLIFKNDYFLRIEGFSKDLSNWKTLENEKNEKIHFYNSLITSINDIVFVFDDKFIISFVSNSVQDFIGYNTSEITSNSLLDILSEKSIPKINNILSLMGLQSKQDIDSISHILDLEIDFITKYGIQKTAYVKMHLLYDTKYYNKSYIAVMRDITEEKKILEENRKSELYFKKLFDESPVMMVITDDLDVILDANKTFVDTVGFTLIELKKMTFTSLIQFDNQHEKDFNKIDIRAKLRTRDEDNLSVLMRPADFTDSNQRRMSLYVIRDVSEQVYAENLRTIRENQYIAIAETSPSVLVRFDKAVICTYANKAIEKQFKLKNEDVLGKNQKEIISDK